MFAGDVERGIYHRRTPITGQQLGVYPGRTISDFLAGAVASGVLADPEAFAVRVDSR